MSDSQKIRLGDAIFNNIDDNDFLNVLYDNMLYNYASFGGITRTEKCRC